MRAWHYLVALTAMLLVIGCNTDQPGTPQQAESSTQETEVGSSEEQQVTAVENTAEQAPAPSDQQAQASEEPPDDSPGLSVGEKAPDFELKDQNGQSRSLTEMLKSGQVAMVYYRSADW